MAGLKEQEKWEEQIYQIEENDPVHGGPNGITNRPARELANRTKYLKKQLETTNAKAVAKTISADSQNTADEHGHSHAIDIASLIKAGIVRLSNALDSDDETKAPTLKAIKILKAFIDSNTRSLGNYIPNSKKNNAINSTSSDMVATSLAVKTAYDKGVSALNKANEVDNSALKKEGNQTLLGSLKFTSNTPNGWANAQFGAQNGYWQIEFHPDPANGQNRRFNVFYELNGVRNYLAFPHFDSGDKVAYQAWVDRRIQGLINASPANLDTLKELADALGNDPNFSRTILQKIGEVKENADGRVSKTGDTMTGNLSMPKLILTGNADGETIKVGDDAFMGDTNIQNTVRVKGQQDKNKGFIAFGNSNNPFGWNGSAWKVGNSDLNHSAQPYLLANDAFGSYGGLKVLHRDFYNILEINHDGSFTFIKRRDVNNKPVNDWVVKVPERSGTLALGDDLVGSVAFFARQTPPTGWLKANGATVSRTTYSALFAAIGTTFGAGDGRTTFNLPDLRGEFIRGFDDGRNIDKSRTFGSWQKGSLTVSDNSSRNAVVGVALKEMQDSYDKSAEKMGFDVINETDYESSAYIWNNNGRNTGTGELSEGSANHPSWHTGGSTRPRNIALLACIKY